MIGLFTRKIGMTRVFDAQNRHVPVTILKVAEQAVTGRRTQARDGYDAAQIGATGRKRVAKPQQDELIKNGLNPLLAHRREIKATELTAGQPLDASLFAPGDTVSVTGISKGKGFAGTIKRHGFSRGPTSHGSKNVRQPGAIGSGYPQRVVKGRKMPGHLGARKTTTRGLTVIAVDASDQTLALRGAVPGSNRSRIFVQKITRHGKT